MVPIFKNMQEDAKVGQVLKLSETFRTAVQMYHADTGELPPYEHSGEGEPPEHKCLSYNCKNLPSWGGPYINKPLECSDSPYGQNVFEIPTNPPRNVTNCMAIVTLQAVSGNAWDLDGDGKEEYGPATQVNFVNVPESSAKKIDEALDKGVPGDWKTKGKVGYNTYLGQNSVHIYLIGNLTEQN
jgi:hypothetical protein